VQDGLFIAQEDFLPPLLDVLRPSRQPDRVREVLLLLAQVQELLTERILGQQFLLMDRLPPLDGAGDFHRGAGIGIPHRFDRHAPHGG
jgi:hypothetical protein